LALSNLLEYDAFTSCDTNTDVIHVIPAVKTYSPGGEPFTLAPPHGYAPVHVTKAGLRQPSVALDQFIFYIITAHRTWQCAVWYGTYSAGQELLTSCIIRYVSRTYNSQYVMGELNSICLTF